MKFDIYKDFLNQKEIDLIISKIYSLHYLWYEAEPDRQKDLDGRLYVLGGCTYLNTAYMSNKELNINFCWLYVKLLAKLMEITDKKCRFHAELPFLGFHISELNEEVTDLLHFHVDNSVQDYDNSVKLSSIKSIAVLIQDSENGAYLDTETDQYKYEVGALHIWNGGTELHRMGGLKSSFMNRRITLQCHMYYDDVKDMYVVYF